MHCGSLPCYGSSSPSSPGCPRQEDDLRAGLLLEQAAHCLLALQPPHVRKFAFHLVLAGLRYDMCAQRSLAHRVYRRGLVAVRRGGSDLVEQQYRVLQHA